MTSEEPRHSPEPPVGFDAGMRAYAGSGGAASSSFVRPYFYTRGRTRAAVELAVEALVSVAPGAVCPLGPAGSAFELCREPRSVAEVAARMGVPLGVARVLLGDLVGAGTAVVHRTADASGPDLDLMQRVLAGLRNL